MDPSTAGGARGLWRSFRRNSMGMVGLAMLLAAVAVAIMAPWIEPCDPDAPRQVTMLDIYTPPSAAHWLGTDDAGGDVFTNLLYGARVSLTVGFFASFIAVSIGGLLGLVAGYAGGRTETIIMRFTDIMLVIPDLPLAVVIVALTRPSLSNIILVIGLLGWTGTARLVRSQTLSVKQRKFVTRARAVGAGNTYIIRRHILPLVLPLLVVNTVLVISLAILNESTLSFLGLGDPSALSWGQMLNFAFTRGAMSAGAWWALVSPGVGIVWVVLACTLLGQGLEQALNPRLAGHHLSVGKRMVARLAPADVPTDAKVAATGD
jgi:peptide/nickel transport system permease protein